MPEDDILKQMWIGAFKRVGCTHCIRDAELRMLRFKLSITLFDTEGVENNYLTQRRHATDPSFDVSPRVRRARLSEVSADDSPVFLRATSSFTTAPATQGGGAQSTSAPSTSVVNAPTRGCTDVVIANQ
jgi:hypothetical protein